MKKKRSKTQIQPKYFIFQKEQRNELLIFTVSYIFVYVILRVLYPYPDGISDSGGYVAAAVREAYDGYRPYGYSCFLNLLKGISQSFGLLVFTQYFINALCSLFFIFTIKYFFPQKNKVFYIIFLVLSLGSILTLYLSTCVLSDSLFASLTVLWIGLNIWFIYGKKDISRVVYLTIIFGILYLLVNLRYTGLYYYGLELIIIILVWIKSRKVFAFMGSILLLYIGLNFYYKQIQTSKESTHVEVFSGFAGWQSTNNALHVLPYIELEKEDYKDEAYAEFANFIEQIDTMFLNVERTTAVYMWSNKYPLKRYMQYVKDKNKWSYLYTWTYLGKEVYGPFGKYIMFKYPGAYIRHFMLPNTLGVLHPTEDQLYKKYNTEAIPSDLLGKYFDISKDTEIAPRSHIVQKVSKGYPLSRLLLWLFFFCAIVFYFLKKLWKRYSREQNVFLIFMTVFVMGYILFHIYATPFEIRYIVPVHMAQMSIIYIVAQSVFAKRALHSGDNKTE